jgi:hypothetical protein
MAKRNRFFKQQPLPLAEQFRQMKLHWPRFSRSLHHSQVSWTGELTPAGMSDTYTIRVTYTPPMRPVVEVISPELKGRPGERIPHTFLGKKLCLHLHQQWVPANTIIATTVIKWAVLWLFFYETWVITGTWEGGGHEPRTKK